MTDDDIKSIVTNIEALLVSMSVRMDALEELMQSCLVEFESKDFTSEKIAKWQSSLKTTKKS